MDSAQPRSRSSDPLLSNSEQTSDPGEDPFSPGSLLETTSSLLGALIAILSLSVPIGGVMADRLSLPAPAVPLSSALRQVQPIPAALRAP